MKTTEVSNNNPSNATSTKKNKTKTSKKKSKIADKDNLNSIMTSMELPDILNSCWGPTIESIPSFSGLPFTPFSKRDSISYIADWDPQKMSRNARRSARRTALGDDAAPLLGVFSDEEDIKFEGAITIQKKKYDVTKKWRRDRTKQANKVSYSQGKMEIKEQKKLRAAPKTQTRKKRIKQKRARRRRYVENPRPLTPSIKKQDHWIDVKDVWFRDTFEMQNNFVFKIDGDDSQTVGMPYTKKLILAGTLHGVLTKYDSSQSGTSYKADRLDFERYSDHKYLSFKYKAATQDPYIMEFANKNVGNIYATDNVLTAIMCCPRSKYSFDIIINKIGNKIFLDERSKILSNFSVDETSQFRPTKKGNSKINMYESLALEATYINHVFNEQMVFHDNLKHTQNFKRKHPFSNEIQNDNNNQSQSGGKKGKNRRSKMSSSGQRPSSQAFTYNLFELTDNINIVCRCTVDGYIVDNKNTKHKDWVIIRALNQYDPTKSKTISWNKYLDTRDGSILSQEVTNNNFKCARWAMNAHLADAKYIKLGFVVRENVHSLERHLIRGVKTFETRDFIRNRIKIRTLETSWTILAKFIKSIQQLDGDGRFIALRDPLKQVIRVYKVTDDSFTKEDGLPSHGYLKKVLNYKDNNNQEQKTQ